MSNKLLSTFTFILVATMCLFLQPTYAANTYKGEFISFSYNVNGNPTSMTVLDQNNRRIKHTISKDVLYYMNGRITNASTIKKGMTISFEKVKNNVTVIRGIENLVTDSIEMDSYTIYGIVTKIDPNGLFITVKPDKLKEQNYYINQQTTLRKGNRIADLSMLYEGDRVKMTFPSATTSTLYELDIMHTGNVVENIYKAKIVNLNQYSNTLMVEEAQAFENWMFGAENTQKLSSFAVSPSATYYVGDKKVMKNELNKYVGSTFYFTTIKQRSYEVIEKIVVLENNERNFYDQINAVNTKYNLLKLNNYGNIYYHSGSILVRNGRLIEPTSLTSSGSAAFITDGISSSTFAHVVNVTNDGFEAANLANYSLYFGELQIVDQQNYLLELGSAVKLEQNYWKSTRLTEPFAFSNGTSAVVNVNSTVEKLIPNMDLWEYESLYGYFYVKGDHVQAMHLLDPSQVKTSRVLTGTVKTASSLSLDVKDVSQWYNGGWIEAAALEQVVVAQTLILKNGKAIDASQIKAGNRVVLLTTNALETQVILVTE